MGSAGELVTNRKESKIAIEEGKVAGKINSPTEEVAREVHFKEVQGAVIGLCHVPASHGHFGEELSVSSTTKLHHFVDVFDHTACDSLLRVRMACDVMVGSPRALAHL